MGLGGNLALFVLRSVFTIYNLILFFKVYGCKALLIRICKYALHKLVNYYCYY